MPARFQQRQRNISVVSGAALRLTCAPSGDGPLRLTWYRRGHLVATPAGSVGGASAVGGAGRLAVTSGEGVSQLSLRAVGREDGGSYTCVARNRHGEDSTTWHVAVTGERDGADPLGTPHDAWK